MTLEWSYFPQNRDRWLFYQEISSSRWCMEPKVTTRLVKILIFAWLQWNHSKQGVIPSPQKHVPSSNPRLHTSPRWRNSVIEQPSILILLKVAPFQHHRCTTFPPPPVGGANADSHAIEVNSSSEFQLYIIKLLQSWKGHRNAVQ